MCRLSRIFDSEATAKSRGRASANAGFAEPSLRLSSSARRSAPRHRGRTWMHFGLGMRDREAVRAPRDRLAADGVELVEEWDEPDYVSVKCRDPDGYIVEASWEPEAGALTKTSPSLWTGG